MQLMIRSQRERIFFDFALPECNVRPKTRESRAVVNLRKWLTGLPPGAVFSGHDAAKATYNKGMSLVNHRKVAAPRALVALVAAGVIAVERPCHGHLNTVYRVCIPRESV